MKDEQLETRSRTPIHLWILGVLALLWNAMGVFDYLMTQTHNENYMSNFTPGQLEFFYGFPTWVVALWAIAVWGGLLGVILLLMRRTLAVPVFLVSFVAMMLTAVRNFFLADGMDVMGQEGVIFSVVIFVVALGLWLYSRSMQKRGVLR